MHLQQVHEEPYVKQWAPPCLQAHTMLARAPPCARQLPVPPQALTLTWMRAPQLPVCTPDVNLSPLQLCHPDTCSFTGPVQQGSALGQCKGVWAALSAPVKLSLSARRSRHT